LFLFRQFVIPYKNTANKEHQVKKGEGEIALITAFR